MKSALSSLQEKRDTFDKMKKNYEDAVAHIQVVIKDSDLQAVPIRAMLTEVLFQVQARYVERQTHEEFQKLRSFLQVEEEARMEALRRDEEQKSRDMRKKIEEMERHITSVSVSIRDLEEEMALDGISILHVSM